MLHNTIHEGDCVSHMAGLPAGSVDLVFADPPFNIGYNYDEYDDGRSSEAYCEWSKRWIAAVVRLLKDDGTFWLAIGDEYAAELKVLATHDLGMTCRNWVIWYYTFGVHCKYKFSRSHVHLFYFVKDEKRYTFNSEAIRVPSARQLVYADKRADAKGRVPDDTWITHPDTRGRLFPVPSAEDTESVDSVCDGVHGEQHDNPPGVDPTGPGPRQATVRHQGWILRPQDLPDGFEPDGDTWYFPRVCGTFKERRRFHGCQMPEQLLARIIRSCSDEGELVLDPFAGTGTTLAVAKKLGRAYLGFELSKDYTRQSLARLDRIRPGDPVDGAADPLRSVADTRNGRRRQG